MTREEAFHVIDIYCVPSAYPHTERWEILQKIKEALEVLKQEPKTGHWIPSHIPESILDECSECGFSCGAFTFKYCPNCGCRMESEE